MSDSPPTWFQAYAEQQAESNRLLAEQIADQRKSHDDSAWWKKHADNLKTAATVIALIVAALALYFVPRSEYDETVATQKILVETLVSVQKTLGDQQEEMEKRQKLIDELHPRSN